MTDADLQKIRVLADGATPGPWRPSPSRIGVVAAIDDGWVCQVNRITPVLDVEFIAASRAAVPQLVDEIVRLRETVEYLKTAQRNQERKRADG